MTTEPLVGYQPIGPYAIQSGKHKGQTLEHLMFENYDLLVWMLKKRIEEGKKDKLYWHLAWLLRQGETVLPKMVCPQCYERPVRFFSVAYSGYSGRDFSVGTLYTYCGECSKDVDAAGKPIQILPFHFSSLNQFHPGSCQKQIADLFRQVFNLPKPLTREQAFEFFNSEPCTE